MSDPHAPAPGDHDAHGHDDHAPEPAEFSNPAVWTLAMVASIAFLVWWFFHFLDAGRGEGRDQGPIPAEKSGAPPIDNLKLMADDTQAVRDRGHQIYNSNCATCHGPNGDTNANNSNPAPRNFHKDAFKNVNGTGPFALFCVVHDGLAGTSMPSFAQLPPEDAYAVVHFIRDTWIKTDNAAHFMEKDPPDVLAKIKPPGEEGDAVKVDPIKVPLPEDLNPLMVTMANGADAEDADTAKTFAAAATAAASDPGLTADLSTVAGALLPKHSEYAATLVAAAKLDTPDRFLALMTAADAPASGETEFALWPRERLLALYALLHQAKA